MKQKNPSNLYLRNEQWWMHIQRGGKRHHFPLHTKELAEAVRKREAYLADPQFLYGFRQQNLGSEVQKYIEGKSSDKKNHNLCGATEDLWFGLAV